MIEKALNYISNLPTDKKDHFSLGMLLSLVFFAMTASHVVSIACVAAIGLAKEEYDRWHPKHTRDMRDFYATVAGAFVVSVFVLLGGLHG